MSGHRELLVLGGGASCWDVTAGRPRPSRSLNGFCVLLGGGHAVRGGRGGSDTGISDADMSYSANL